MTESDRSRSPDQEPHAPTSARPPQRSEADEPIAIVGIACRFPGARNLPDFWSLLERGGNAVSEGEPGSGIGRMGEMYPDKAARGAACRFGAFVDDIDRFDASFFRISPVEAQLLDPQQRMMLETSWHALEDAGIDPDRLKGTRTGVYTGISTDEYRMMVLDSARPSEAAGCLYALSGTNMNGAAGRVSFVLGLMGPAKAVDAACASSLVSVHDAVADLQQGKADLAIAGGVHTMLNGRVYELRADSMMLSPDGQCKAFDASANGYVRGEGCGVVVLKRLGEAEADGDRIWAVICGAAVNHGGASVGLTVPNTPALEQVIDAALSRAGLSPSEVDYLEAHGTGTTVGDPIELNAAVAVYGRGREADHPLLVGSVKTNVGHLEAAAGVAGLIKAAMVVKSGVIPKHLHFRDPNPSLDWERLPVRVTTEAMEWPDRGERPRRAGVNSFGISGTNAHIVLEEHRAPHAAPAGELRPVGSARRVPIALPVASPDSSSPEQEPGLRATRVLPLSGKTEPALRDLARRYLPWLDERVGAASPAGAAPRALLSDMAWTAGVGRSHFDHRKGIAFRDADSLRKRLEEVADSADGAMPRGRTTRVAFAYTGQGSQWVGMGRDLYEREPVARVVLDRCEAVFRERRGTSLLDVMFGRAGAGGDLSDTAWEQPALYALECALTALWSSVGVRPSVVVGHSAGELAAAQAAGVFSLEDGMHFSQARGTALAGTERGAMAAVFAPPARVASAVETLNSEREGTGISVSADNGLHQVVSGPVEAIETISERLESEGVRVRRLNTTRAFHSALVEPALEALEASLGRVAISPPGVDVVSNLTGRVVEPGTVLDGAYWRRHARERVSFGGAVWTMADLGVDLVIEIGPRSLLAPLAVSAWPDSAPPPRVISSMAPPADEAAAPGPDHGFMDAVAEAYEAGLEIRFDGLFAGEARRRISIPDYPFQRERYWLEAPKRRHRTAGHPLLGVRHESASGEVSYETEVFPTEPAWLGDHRVFGRVVAPGALYGAMAASASLAEGSGRVAVEEMQLHNPLVFSEPGSGDGPAEDGRTMQVLLGAPDSAMSRRVQVFSRGGEEEWTIHVEGRVTTGAPAAEGGARIDLEDLISSLSPLDASTYYRARAGTGVELGPSFRTLGRIWCGPGEALGEVSLPEAAGRSDLDLHPLLLDGCFQVVGAARGLGGSQGRTTYLPFAWERFWLAGQLPERVFCHVRMRAAAQDSESEPGGPPEVQSGDLRLYDPNGVPIGGLSGYTVKRATRAALLSSIEGIDDLLYEVVWQERALPPGVQPADFFPDPAAVKARARLLPDYLRDAGVDPRSRDALLADLERWSQSFAIANLDRLGWVRKVGERVRPEELRKALNVNAEHERLFRRMLEMAARAGVLAEEDDTFVVRSGSGDPWPAALPEDPERHAERMAERYPHGLTEIGLFRRSGGALADVLRGQADPLTLLFSSGEPTAADLYLRAPVARAANQMLSEAVRTLVATLPPGRRLRVVEIGAGTGSATAAVLPELPEGRFDYMYTDISAGFFSEAEARFGDGGGCIEYRPLDIEKDPIEQGFDLHGYDLAIASNVLHATRYLEETLAHCGRLLAPSGHLVALENLRGLGWMDLTFGQLDGWWRFADDFRPHHALAGPAVWRRALSNSGFEAVEVLGVDESDPPETMDKGVIVAKGPAEVRELPGSWILAADTDGLAADLAERLAARNQTVVLAGATLSGDDEPFASGPGVRNAPVDADERDSWRGLVEGLPPDLPFNGVVHCAGLDGHGAQATTGEVMEDVSRAGASALALVQGVSDSDRTPEKGVWFLTRGAQILERERGGSLAGAVLWGFGKAVDREAAHLRPRMIDLDPASMAPAPDLVNELLYPDPENHIAYRWGRRQVARLVRAGDGRGRLVLPEQSDWVLAPDQGGTFDRPWAQPLPVRALEAQEVLVGVDAAGLNFWDVFRSLGFIQEGLLGREMCGRILATGSDVRGVSVGDRVVGLGFGAFGPQMITREELVAPAPEGYSVSELASAPSAFVSAALSFELSGLEAGERVLVHAGAGGVGLAAIQLVQAAGAEVFATASAPKQAYLASLGVDRLFDSRSTEFAGRILEATGGEGVDIVLNSLTSEGFIDASLSCLKRGGRFVELARRDILSEEEMAALRPDVGYDILELDVLKKTEPAWVGRVLSDITRRLGSGELKPIVHSRWPLCEAGPALRFMRSARHLGKIVVTASPLAQGRLRPDRTYLVTGGLGGIGCAVAVWLADHGAGTIVLNGRREPDADAEETIRTLRERGVNLVVELADVTDIPAIDRMLERIDRDLPPLAGVIHSVGVLSDGALTNQSWARFENVLWPKILAAWHLHRATEHRDLDLFILFSSRVGVMGNPGQANHAAANAFLDQLAGHRRAMGLPGQAIAWGAWSEIGEAAEQKDRIERQRSALGGRWFTPQQGLKAMERLVRQDVTTSVVMSMDWSVFEEAVEERPPFLEDLLSADAESDDGRATFSADVATRLRETPVSERGSLLVSFLQGEVQAVLRLPSTPDPSVGFFDLGMDSLMAVELRNRLNRAFAGDYTASNTVVFDYPDIASLARHVVEELGEVEAEPAPRTLAEQTLAEPVSRPAPQPVEDGIAIVGMACRFPGAPDLDAFWQLLEAGRSAVTDGRPDPVGGDDLAADSGSWSDAYRHGGFIAGIDRFDARFFGIRPIEARTMDPRQRLLLETTWQALEDAGIDPGTLRGGRAGVYAGLGGSEYRDVIALGGNEVAYLGTAGSVAVGRVAFALGLSGPAMALDMTCASSLAAMHQAAVGLERGEVDVALAGGVHAVLSPGVTKFMAELGLLSASGRCRPFGADADGFVRGEGCGMVVLKRLAEAQGDGDRILAVIRGSAVNQSGASAGLTVPNGPAQERVIEEALSRAGIAPCEVDYLEAHGTGSAMGDPIEVRAATAVYGRGRAAERPLLVGSFKPNIGHPESAAGIAGLIKVVLAMQQRLIPPQPDFRNPSPLIEWDELPVRVTSQPTPWPLAPDRPPRAGISAFGVSGANAHVVVEGYDGFEGSRGPAPGAISPAGAARPVAFAVPEPLGGSVEDAVPDEGFAARTARLLPLSGKSDEALSELAARYLSWLDEGPNGISAQGEELDPRLSDMAWTASVGRSHFGHRAGVVFRDAQSLREGLSKLCKTDERPAAGAPARVAFAFPDGTGTWAGMGEILHRSEPVARAVLERCETAFRDLAGASLLDPMFARAGSDAVLHDPAWSQLAVYALECALAALWSSVGVRPGVVFGQGTGEIAAAQAAGMFSLEDGLRLALARGRRFGMPPEVGAQSGALADLQDTLAGVAMSPATVPFVSGTTGRTSRPGAGPEGDYWQRQAVESLDPGVGVAALVELEVDAVVEIGPDTALGPAMLDAWPHAAGRGAPVVVTSLRRSVTEDAETAAGDAGFAAAVAQAYEAGFPLRFEGLFAGEARRRISLPGYPFQRRRFWMDTVAR